MQSITFPRGRALSASTTYTILDDFKAPIQLLQNNGGTDANVTFSGGAALVIKASETIVFQLPVAGEITSDQDLIALA